jgi:hypothetical protein
VTISVDTFKINAIVFIGDVIMCLTSDSPICELRTDLIFLWSKVSSVIQTLSVAHMKGKMFNLQITDLACKDQMQNVQVIGNANY